MLQDNVAPMPVLFGGFEHLPHMLENLRPRHEQNPICAAKVSSIPIGMFAHEVNLVVMQTEPVFSVICLRISLRRRIADPDSSVLSF